jgi:predicted RNase H-like HicB family nuclease
MIYGIVFEDATDGGVGAYLPDVPGVAVVAPSRMEAIPMLDKALRWQVEAMIEDGVPLPDGVPGKFEYCLVLDNTFVQHIPDGLQSLFATPTNVTPFWTESRPARVVDSDPVTAAA